MDREQQEQRMAEYLGGELKGAEREAFEAALQRDPDLARELESLERTVTRLRGLTGDENPDLSRPNRIESAGRPATRQAFVLAAAMILAFAAGLFVRMPFENSDRFEPGQQSAVTVGVTPDSSESHWKSAVAEVCDRHPDLSDLGRSWIALARVMKD